MEELLNLINVSLYVMVKDELVCLTFLTSSQPELSEKISSKVYEPSKKYLHEFTAANEQSY